MTSRRQVAGFIVTGVALAGAAFSAAAGGAEPAPHRDPAWADAHRKPAMTAEDTRRFIRRLAQYVVDHHLKTAENSPQRGMIYEYFHVARQGQHDQFIQDSKRDSKRGRS